MPVTSYHLNVITASDAPLERDDDGDLALAPAKPKLKRPPMYKVMMHNDDYTPMEFVVYVLKAFFGLENEKATHIMMTVHTQGKAVCGVFPRDIAETKAEQVTIFARDNEHPLMCDVEADSDEGDE